MNGKRQLASKHKCKWMAPPTDEFTTSIMCACGIQRRGPFEILGDLNGPTAFLFLFPHHSEWLMFSEQELNRKR